MSWMKMQIYSLTLGGAYRKENSCSCFCIPKTKYKRARKDSYLWIVFYVPAADLGKRVDQKSGCLLGLSFLTSKIWMDWSFIDGMWMFVDLNSFKLKCSPHQIFGLNILLNMHRPFKLNSFVTLLYCFHHIFKIRSKECNTLSSKIIILYDYVVCFLLNCHSPPFQNFLHSKWFTYSILLRMASYIHIISLSFTILNSRRDTHRKCNWISVCVAASH